MEIQTGDEKMRELILYLAAKSETDPRFSSTKLNKLLFYCDFGAYRQLGQSITGHSYRKLQFSPAPKAMLPILEQMKGDRGVRRDRAGPLRACPAARRRLAIPGRVSLQPRGVAPGGQHP